MYITGGRKVVKKVIAEIQPKNPNKLLQFLDKEMKIPDIHNLELQELVNNILEWGLG